jgi:phage I-like protein
MVSVTVSIAKPALPQKERKAAVKRTASQRNSNDTDDGKYVQREEYEALRRRVDSLQAKSAQQTTLLAKRLTDIEENRFNIKKIQDRLAYAFSVLTQ